MTPREAFKAGFLSACVDRGLGISEIREVVKTAMDKLAAGGNWYSGAKDLVKDIVSVARPALGVGLQYAVPIGLAAPPIIGGTLGWTLAKAQNSSAEDADEIKARELQEEYQRQAERIRMLMAARKRQASSVSRPW